MQPWAWLVLLVAGRCGASPLAPAAEDECVGSDGDEMEFRCAQGRYTLQGTRFQYVKIICEDIELKCSTFPRKWFAKNSTLERVTLEGCAFDGPLSCLLAKMGIADVHQLFLMQFLTPISEKHFEGLKALTGLYVFDRWSSSVQKAIPYKVISSLPKLNDFRINRAQVTLRPGQFQAPMLKFLELSSGSIAEVPPGSFEGLPSLQSLQLWKNDISQLHNDSFIGLQKLDSLSLSRNSLPSLEGGALRGIPTLRQFSSVDNPLLVVRDDFFRGHRHLETIKISSSKPLELEPRAFSDLKSLQELILESCLLQDLPETVFSGSVSIKSISLKYNKLEYLHPEVFRDQAAMVKLDLSRNKLKNLSDDLFITLKKLTELDLNYNLLETFPNNLFSALTSLQTLSASHNRLKHIDDMAFQGTPLRTLRLADNRLTFSDSRAEYEYSAFFCPFNGLTQLRTLDLSENLVEDICDYWRFVMTQLESLDLSHNRISVLMPQDFDFLGSNLTVNLQYNIISTVILDPLSWLNKSYPAQFILDNNPLDCDCRIYSFLKTATSPNYSKYFSLDGVRCSSPLRLNGTEVTQVQLDRLVCDVPCPSGCDCVDVPDKNIVEARCSGVDSEPSNITVAVALKLTREPKSLRRLPFENVLDVDLSGLGLTEFLIDSLPESVKFLNLSNNELRYVTSDLLNRNIKLDVTRNPLRCNCWNSKNIAELQRNQNNIVDYEATRCEDGTLVSQVDVQRICDVLTAAYISITVIGVGVFLFLFATVFIYKYSFEVKIYVSKYLPCLLPEEKYDASKKYDVFVSYAHQDEDFIRDVLLPKLEGPPINVKTCLHSRDWAVGETIPYNIAKSVEESRRTVIVLSGNFLKSIWGLLEFRAAHVQATKEGRTRVVVILLEDVTNRKELDREISAYLHTNTYIKWGDPWFWDKLAYALPKASKMVDRVEEKRLQSVAKKLVHSGLDVQLNDDGKLINAAFVKDV